MDVWKCPVCAKPLFLSTDYIFFRQIFKQQPHCDALLAIKKTHTKPRQQAGGSQGGRKLNKYSIKNLSKNIVLNNPPSSPFSSWQGFPNGKWLLGSRTYTLWSAQQLSTCLILHTCSSPSLFICVSVVHRTGSLISLCLLVQKKSVPEELVFQYFSEIIVLFFSPASISHWNYPQTLIHVQWFLKYMDIG